MSAEPCPSCGALPCDQVAMHAARTPDPSTAEKLEWRCFQCGEAFTDRKLAEDHFGLTSLHPAACVDPLRSDERAMRERAMSYERCWREALAQRDEAVENLKLAKETLEVAEGDLLNIADGCGYRYPHEQIGKAVSEAIQRLRATLKIIGSEQG